MKKDSIAKNDLKQFWFDLKHIYPAVFSRFFIYWQVTLLCLFLIFSSFYLDSAVRLIFATIHNDFTADLFEFGRWFGDGQPTAILFVIIYTWGMISKNLKIRDTGLLVGESYIFSGLLTLIFKCVFGRWRPYTEHGDFSFDGWHLTGNDYYSFFSGHSQTAFAIAVILAGRTENIYLKVFFYALAVNTALSRIFHDQHWLSDVVTGGIVAIVVGRQLLEFHNARLQAVPAESNENGSEDLQ
jgi:membrane-associated phospholipid phosphatase